MKYYQSANTRAKWVYVTFAILALLALAAIISKIAEINLINELEDEPWSVSNSEIQSNDDRESTIGISWFFAYLLTVPAFLLWIYRAHQNLPSIGAYGLRFVPGWAVGWFFIPIMSLFRPYQVTSEIWRASDPDIPAGDTWRNARTSPLVGWWWAFFILSGISLSAAANSLDSEDLANLRNADYVYIFSYCVAIIGIIITIAMVSAITSNQEQKSFITETYPKNIVSEYRYCQNCGKALPNESKYCQNCGAGVPLGLSIKTVPGSFADDPINASTNSYICPHCGKEVAAEWKFCPCCGEEPSYHKEYYCARCGSKVEKGWRVCPQCGEDLTIGDKEPTPCPLCGQLVPVNAKACPYCGASTKS